MKLLHLFVVKLFSKFPRAQENQKKHPVLSIKSAMKILIKGMLVLIKLKKVLKIK